MSEASVQEQIDRTTAERQQAWRVGDAKVVERCTTSLDGLYAKLRAERAKGRSGDRKTILKRARIEREIDKLAQV